MREYRLICLPLAFVFILLVSASMTFATPWYKENFDGLPNGDLIGKGGWTGFHGFLVVQDKVAHGGSGKSIKTVPDGEADLKLPEERTGVQYISFYTSKKTFDPYVAFYAGDSPDGKWNQQGVAVHLNFTRGGVVEVNDGAAMKDIGIVYVKEQWHHFKLLIDFDNGDYQVFFDDNLIAEHLGFESTPKKLNWLRIIAGETHPLAYFDDFEIGDMSEKNVMPKSKLITTWSRIKSVR